MMPVPTSIVMRLVRSKDSACSFSTSGANIGTCFSSAEM